MLIEQANITPVASNMSKIKKLSFDLRSMYTEVATEKANERMIDVKAEHHHIGNLIDQKYTKPPFYSFKNSFLKNKGFYK